MSTITTKIQLSITERVIKGINYSINHTIILMTYQRDRGVST